MMSPFLKPSRNSPAETRWRRRPGGRRKIAVLIDYMTLFVGAYEGGLRAAFDTTCRRQGLDLLLVYGQGIDEPTAWSSVHNSIYDLLSADSVDGLVALSSSIATHCGANRMAAFLGRYGELPLCSLGLELPGIPSILVDHETGMEEVVEHLIGKHGCRRIAFIAGTPGHADAEVRIAAYRKVLGRHSIPFDAALVQSGNFVRDGGRSATERLLASKVQFDALVAANDVMALAAIEVLREHGLRVPHDVPVTGFDDILLARLGSPPMTTVAQPFAAMAESAIALLVAQMDGIVSQPKVTLASQLIVRGSCGCVVSAGRQHQGANSRMASNSRATLSQKEEAIRFELRQILNTGSDLVFSADPLLSSLQHSLDGREQPFLNTLETILERFGDDPEDCHALQKAISFLREQFKPGRHPGLEDLWHDARELLALFNTRGQVRRRNEIDAAYARMLSFGEQVSSALDLSSLKSLFEKSFPVAGIRTVWISQFAPGTTSELEPVIALVNGTPVNTSAGRFEASQLVPPDAYDAERRHTLLIFPMVCEMQNFGVAAFDYTADINGYQLIRDQVSAALRTIHLHQEVVQKTMLHERSVQERAASAKRMQALSVLAGGVAHDLNNALGPLVGLPDVMLGELARLAEGSGDVAELRTDLETIRSATLRAAQTIKDLLTLSRQGRTPKERLDLNHAVRDAVGGDALRALRLGNPNVRISCDVCCEPLVVFGSEAHIGRAVINLVRNAVEAATGIGQVRIQTLGLQLSQRISGYETVEPGDYAVVVVSDDGVGIPAHELGWVFEPFTSKKQVSESSGTGLGLAIVHGVVKEHEGFVDVSSTGGVGTTFTLYFPRVAGDIRRVLTTAHPHRGSANILVVDDEPIQLRTAERILRNCGYTVQTLASGKAALNLLAQVAADGKSPFDLVLLDMMLNEDKDGLQVFEEIRRQFPEQRAIIVSGHAPTERVERAFEEGLGWLPKPYAAQALASAVVAVLARHGTDASQRPSLRVPRSAREAQQPGTQTEQS